MRIAAVSRPCGRIAPYKYPSKRSLTAGMTYSCTREQLHIRRISMGTAMKSHLLSKTISEQTLSNSLAKEVESSLTIVKVEVVNTISNRYLNEAQPKKAITITFKLTKIE